MRTILVEAITPYCVVAVTGLLLLIELVVYVLWSRKERVREKDMLITVVNFLTLEWILKRTPNGGAVVILRSAVMAIQVFAIVLMALYLLDPFKGIAALLGDHLHWFGAIFAGIYVALYARFAAQWSYLAGLYNQIKAAEMGSVVNYHAFYEWKAGFIEDCETLHLARKELFQTVIAHWIRETFVKEEFISHTLGGKERLERLEKATEDCIPPKQT